jgi:hypothetical protein
MSHEEGPDRSAGWILFFFSLAIAATGAGTSYLFFLRPRLVAAQASAWIPTPCTIKQSSMVSEKDIGSAKTLYGLDIRYEYEFSDEAYTSTRVEVDDFTTTDRKGRSRVLKEYPAGAQGICYVDPDDPAEAVLVRDVGFDPLTLIPLGFLLLGSLGVLWAITIIRRTNRSPLRAEAN